MAEVIEVDFPATGSRPYGWPVIPPGCEDTYDCDCPTCVADRKRLVARGPIGDGPASRLRSAA